MSSTLTGRMTTDPALMPELQLSSQQCRVARARVGVHGGIVACRVMLAVTMLGSLPPTLLSAEPPWDSKVADILTAKNPSPGTLPTLGVWKQACGAILLSAQFPDVPGLTTDSWCYEGDLEFLAATDAGGGVVELRHRVKTYPRILVVTRATPSTGRVDFVASVERDDAAGGELPNESWAPGLNMCWQVKQGPAFASRPGPYPAFIRRCFIFTDAGRVFLDETIRRAIPCRAIDDPYNNPPYVQTYIGAWQAVPPAASKQAWAECSPTQYTASIMGVVSRDGKHLAAIANDSARSMSQAWHDCMHNNAEWQPAERPLASRTWRVSVYAMKNDVEMLRAQVERDYPGIKHQRNLPRMPTTCPVRGELSVQTRGIRDGLPLFRDRLGERMRFPLSWLSGKYNSFSAWREAARAKVIECLMDPPPPADIATVVLSEQDRGTYVARKIVFNLTGDSRVAGLMLVPKGKGPFPAVLLLHDHGARFDIGKEKVIRPWQETPERMTSAEEWVKQCYGGRFIGDELAKRGYVCFATDALNWSDRGGAGYNGQQALASNLMHFGITWAGLIAHEDMRAADFLAACPEVDSKRIAAMGLSMGAYRTWQLAALSDRIRAGAAICWMATVKGLMVPGNNQTVGQSSFAFLHPGLSNYLDYPDIASIACPKPMLFFNGRQDLLFPVQCVEDAYSKMREVWTSQKAGDKLVTRLWDVPHVFNIEMQEAVFEWLDEQLRR